MSQEAGRKITESLEDEMLMLLLLVPDKEAREARVYGFRSTYVDGVACAWEGKKMKNLHCTLKKKITGPV